jgi:hypothetical protein
MRTAGMIVILAASIFGGAICSRAASQEPSDEIVKFYFARSYTPSDRVNLANLYAAFCRGRLDATRRTHQPVEICLSEKIFRTQFGSTRNVRLAIGPFRSKG